jgi:hypothetical protein
VRLAELLLAEADEAVRLEALAHLSTAIPEHSQQMSRMGPSIWAGPFDRQELLQLATLAGAPTAQRRSPALGASPIGSLAHPRPGPAPLLSTIGPGEHSGSRTSAAWKIPRSPSWTASRSATPL